MVLLDRIKIRKWEAASIFSWVANLKIGFRVCTGNILVGVDFSTEILIFNGVSTHQILPLIRLSTENMTIRSFMILQVWPGRKLVNSSRIINDDLTVHGTRRSLSLCRQCWFSECGECCDPHHQDCGSSWLCWRTTDDDWPELVSPGPGLMILECFVCWTDLMRWNS